MPKKKIPLEQSELQPAPSVIHAEEKFGAGKPPELPEFTLEELITLGVTVVDTEKTKMIEIPFLAQKKIAEATKAFGFGAAKALDATLKKILKLMGFDGRIQFKTDDKFTWIAWQDKTEPKDGPEPTDETKAQVALSHDNLGLSWTAIIQQHYGHRFEQPLPGALVALMLTQARSVGL